MTPITVCRNDQIVSEHEPVHGNEKKKCLYQVFTRAINYFLLIVQEQLQHIASWN